MLPKIQLTITLKNIQFSLSFIMVGLATSANCERLLSNYAIVLNKSIITMI